ncbi:sterol desaturase family protein [Halomonas elongata]|uniref:Sterol desaturase domain protein n=1 Tax=Halomonas elongata (strain ATCC 33173 / DSM 2581 / NBRC 15536 / NCIMB 2198 / 1H9) TaxID=768066 RepID=E1V622_HALED|nr:sterol desaturase family protein [Halomonas elongata]WBF16949.1 sterol desaturase family protein [Halomonas elongata]WPU45780.1 sterol desaturase family protein [Halomonas elongata DSM 2581]CBV43192.1 sterol desaturase domain protein [Halomonas elongata DSM 2581]
MIDTILMHEPAIRLGVFTGVLAAMALWEIAAPRRPQHYSRRQRWPHNLMIVALDTLAVRLVFPLAAVGAAHVAAERGWGLFNTLASPGWLAVVVSFVALDMAIYFQHRLFHAVPWFWRLHRMHHADLEFDVTTGLRFHPLEILLSMVIKLAAVTALGAPVLAVLIFEVVLNATSMFNHGNVRLPGWLDRHLRRFVVTPEMHRVHHSIIPRETDSNFGFNLPWWDHLFGTYRAQPAAGHLGMTIGLEAFRNARALRLDRLLIQPFVDTSRHESESKPRS